MTDRPTIAVVDYGMGNRRSVQKALEHVGARALITRQQADLSAADALVVPGVGAFPQGMANLVELGLDEQIRAAAHSGKPVLGICLGMQLLFDRSQEHELTDGLGLIPGEVSRLRSDGLRIPHIGWNEVTIQRASALTADLGPGPRPFYHVHSLVARPREAGDVVATTVYGERFASIVARDSVLGVQFHPEKSSLDGLRLLRSFTTMCRGGGIGLTGSVGWAGSVAP
jgi:imidazole glycerol-phosphate synthase subunit HisH